MQEKEIVSGKPSRRSQKSSNYTQSARTSEKSGWVDDKPKRITNRNHNRS